MQETLTNSRTWLGGLFSLAILMVTGAYALAQDTDTAGANSAAAGGGGQYFIEFRARYAWDYGHTFIVHGRVGERLTKASVAGLSPVGDISVAPLGGTNGQRTQTADHLKTNKRTIFLEMSLGGKFQAKSSG
jgi:hypothetical protein